jgi:cell wall-associated NlpC family hydrolase
MNWRFHQMWFGLSLFLALILLEPIGANPGNFRSSPETLVKRGHDLARLGIPYNFGGVTNAGMDCSASVQRFYKALGVTVPRNSEAQAHHLAKQGRLFRVAPWETEEEVLARLQTGDLLFWTKKGEPNRISHVMVYVNHHASTVRLWGARGKGKTGMNGSGVDFHNYRPRRSGKLVAYGSPR